MATPSILAGCGKKERDVDIRSASVGHGQARDQHLSRRSVGRQRNVVNVAHPQESLDVGFVGVGAERVDQEDHPRDLSDRDPSRDLCIASQRPGQHSLYRQPRGVCDSTSGRPRREQPHRLESHPMLLTKGHQLCFLVVVGDQGQGDHAETIARPTLALDGLDRPRGDRIKWDMDVRRAITADASDLARLNEFVHRLHVEAEPTRYQATVFEDVRARFEELLGYEPAAYRMHRST